MTRTAFTVTSIVAAGTVLPASGAVDAGNGNSFVNDGRTIIEVTNGAAAPINVTFTTNGVYNVGSVAYAVADPVIAVVNATSKVFGPFDKLLYNDTATGTVFVDWSSGTTITARVLSLAAG